ncbi:CAP domain-containing protein [Candidatus Woesebacteria bacterium]|nr:CAP domain-containing protein [Candidatus Woesebacteria bacterium]MCD8526918.1 CAP domain-containing protein [Candidatus Woesebacteria bacterium]
MATFSDRWEQTPLLQPLRGAIQTFRTQTLQRFSESPAAEPTPSITAVEVETVMAHLRAENNVATPSANQALEKFARLLTLEIEDQNSLQLENTNRILESLTTTPPEKVEILSLFAPLSGNFDLKTELAEDEVFANKNLTEFGIATRSASLGSTSGTIVSLVLSTPFTDTVSPQTAQTQSQAPVQARPTYTGEDLWAAVQAYRRAHSLPEFQQSNELCTVASIRLNEQLELGRLDNHDGFDARADQFFADHPSWTNINENLAAGYSTAVQAVEWGWDQSLGHKALIQSREYPYACTAANHGFAVLITGS